jgi:hypothetical protein
MDPNILRALDRAIYLTRKRAPAVRQFLERTRMVIPFVENGVDLMARALRKEPATLDPKRRR